MTTPADLGGLLAWYKADALTLAANAAVSSWPDSSGNGRTATQANGTDQPVFRTNRINGLPAVEFDGASDHLLSAAPSGGSPQTLFAVVKLPAAAGSLVGSFRGGEERGALQWRHNGGGVQLLAAGEALIGSGNVPLVFDAPRLLTADFTQGSAWTLLQQGAADASGTSTAPLTARTSRIGGAFSFSTAGEYMQGDLAELFWFNRVLPATERASMHTYLQDKWAVSAADYVTRQVLRTSSTVAAGGWTAVGDATLHGAIDEPTANDADYITATGA